MRFNFDVSYQMGSCCCAAVAQLTTYCAQGSGWFLCVPDEELKSAATLLV